MTLAGRAVALFPVAILAGMLACLVWLCHAPGLAPAAALLAVSYVVPVAAFRAHQAVWPIKIGATHLGGRRYVPWWGAHQLQYIYIALPQLEALLRIVPGLYSAWLRLWGARIGRRVHWTPNVDISDRSLLEVGDDVVIGHRTALYAHLIRKSKDNLLLYVKPICIESDAFVGGYSIFGPGVRIKAGANIDGEARGYPNQVLR
ncbi:MAG: hypothetical protein JWN44_4317 [Myxococcales bacterium]|nr:hypothetical protein [Myxococcales bacterium]